MINIIGFVQDDVSPVLALSVWFTTEVIAAIAGEGCNTDNVNDKKDSSILFHTILYMQMTSETSSLIIMYHFRYAQSRK